MDHDPLKLYKTRQLWLQRPEVFAKDVLGITLYDKQIEIMNSVRDNRITTVASCNAAGKTGTAGIIVPWYLLSYDESIVITTAPTWRQVKDLLWREIATRYEKAKERGVQLFPQSPNVVSLQISPNWYAVGVSSKDPTRVMGYHADSGHLLAIGDEASGIDELIFGGIDSLLTSELCRALYIGNPVSGSGRFRDSHRPNYPSNKIRISVFDTPNFRANNIRNEEDLVEAIESKRKLQTPYPQLVSPIWAYERIGMWGINSPMYQAKVRAKFPDVGENTLIPLSWIEAATTDERLEKILGLHLKDPSAQMSEHAMEKLEKENAEARQTAMAEYIKAHNTNRGVDVARFGSDSTVITPRWSRIVGQQRALGKMDTMETAGHIWPLIRNMPTDITGVDVIGVGSGVVDRLHELQREQEALGFGQWAQILAVNVASSPSDEEMKKELKDINMEFANKRAELYWKLKGMFERGEIYLMPDKDGRPPEALMYELSAIQYKFVGNKIYIEEKAEMKKRLDGKSPDRADSLMLSLELASNEGGWFVQQEDDETFRRKAEELEDQADDEPERGTVEEELELSNSMDEVY
jgi:phage terminase large subunit